MRKPTLMFASLLVVLMTTAACAAPPPAEATHPVPTKWQRCKEAFQTANKPQSEKGRPSTPSPGQAETVENCS